MILHPSSFYCFMPKNTGKIYLKGLRHIEVEEILLVNQVSAEVETDIHAGLHFDADSGAEVGEHPLYPAGVRPHESASAPCHETEMADHLFYPARLVGIEHLAVFGHHDVRRLIAILPHVITTEVERSSAQGILVQRHVSEYVFRLCRPGDDLAPAHRFILPVVYFKAVEFIVTAEEFLIHHPPEIKIDTPIGIGGNVPRIIRQQKTESGAEIAVSVRCSSCGHVVGLVYKIFRRFGYFVIVDVYLRAGKEIAFAQTEQEPGIYLYAAITVLAGRIAPYIIFIGIIADAIEVLLCVFITKLPEDTETVALEEKLRFGEKVQSPFEHKGNSDRDNRTLLCRIAGVHTERHECATAYKHPEIRSIAGAAKYVVMEITLCHPLFTQFTLG